MTIHVDLSSLIVLLLVQVIALLWGSSYKANVLFYEGATTAFLVVVTLFAGGTERINKPMINVQASMWKFAVSITGCVASFLLHYAELPYWALACGFVSAFIVGSSLTELSVCSLGKSRR